jgi:hypothetical protein
MLPVGYTKLPALAAGPYEVTDLQVAAEDAAAALAAAVVAVVVVAIDPAAAEARVE